MISGENSNFQNLTLLSYLVIYSELHCATCASFGFRGSHLNKGITLPGRSAYISPCSHSMLNVEQRFKNKHTDKCLFEALNRPKGVSPKRFWQVHS